MRNYSTYLLSGLLVGSAAFVISSCKDDEPTKYQLSFVQTTISANEADETLDIEIRLDKPAPKDITVKYSLAGTAYDDIRAAAEDEDPDFTVDSDYEEVEIKEGETSAFINLIPYSDELVEDDETIEITITEVSDVNVQFDAASKATITLLQQDGMLLLLTWPAAGVSGVADMDLFVRIGQTAATPTYDGILTGSVYRGFDSNFEVVFIPSVFTGDFFGLGYTNSTYGITHNYYDGTLDPLTFKVAFVEFKNGDFEPEAQQQIVEQTYTAVNINKWAAGVYPTTIVQTIQNNAGTFSDASAIIKPDAGSRVGSPSINKELNTKRAKFSTNNAKVTSKRLNEILSHH